MKKKTWQQCRFEEEKTDNGDSFEYRARDRLRCDHLGRTEEWRPIMLGEMSFTIHMLPGQIDAVLDALNASDARALIREEHLEIDSTKLPSIKVKVTLLPEIVNDSIFRMFPKLKDVFESNPTKDSSK
jgi:hypothetical protein